MYPAALQGCVPARGSASPLRLNGGNRHGIDYVGDTAATREVIDRLVQPLQDRANRHGAGRSLHGLVGVVAGVQVREEKFGLLFYNYRGPRLYFVPSKDLIDADFWLTLSSPCAKTSAD